MIIGGFMLWTSSKTKRYVSRASRLEETRLQPCLIEILVPVRKERLRSMLFHWATLAPLTKNTYITFIFSKQLITNKYVNYALLNIVPCIQGNGLCIYCIITISEFKCIIIEKYGFYSNMWKFVKGGYLLGSYSITDISVEYIMIY